MLTSNARLCTRWPWTGLCLSRDWSVTEEIMARAQRAQLVSVVILATAICASAEVRKEFRFAVGSGAVVSISNQYGPISVKAGAGTQVFVVAILHSEQVE